MRIPAHFRLSLSHFSPFCDHPHHNRISRESSDRLLVFSGVSELLALPCEHFFCKTCILPWLDKTNSCPVCRHELETEEVPPPRPPDSPPLLLFGEDDNTLLLQRRRELAARDGGRPPMIVRGAGAGGQGGLIIFPMGRRHGPGLPGGPPGGGAVWVREGGGDMRVAGVGQTATAWADADADTTEGGGGMEVEQRVEVGGRRRRRGMGRCCIM